MQFIVGAYAASPTARQWDPAAEDAYLTGLAAIPGLRGLEVPFTGQLHHDEDWLLGRLDPTWDLVLTGIPGTVARVAADSGFGLASSRDDGRRAAVVFTSAMRDAVRRVHDHLGRRAVIAVELHSAPTATGTAAAFAASLNEISEWDWDGVALTVEHCDAVRPGQAPQKGYLPLTDELSAVAATPTVAGVTLNWGRSAIEGRDSATPRQHIAAAVAAGGLAGLMFSGAAAVAGQFGEPWLDAHLPPSSQSAAGAGVAELADLHAVEPTSLLGPAEIGQALRAAGGQQLFTGVKIGVRPLDAPIERRLAYLRDAVTMIDRIAATTARSVPSDHRS